MEMSKNTRNEENSASQSSGQITLMPPIVRFDSACSLCIMLAEFMAKRVSPTEMVFLPSEIPSPEKLEVEFTGPSGQTVLVGEYAWKWLLEHHPDLDQINWIAQKLGITTPASRYLMRVADILRRFCFRCR